jgi:hypothetical protein
MTVKDYLTNKPKRKFVTIDYAADGSINHKETTDESLSYQASVTKKN